MAASPEIRMQREEEGLGLGSIEMSEGIAGSTEFVSEYFVSESRHRSFRHHSRLSPSFSSLPSFIPFAKSFKGPSSPSKATKDALSVQRKASLQQHHLSGDIISYPIISRTDFAPTYTPSTNVPTVPPAQESNPMAKSRSKQATGSETHRRGSKTKPPPLKLAVSTHSSFLRRLGRDKAGEELNGLLAGRRAPSQMAKEKQTKAEAEARTAARAAFPASFSDAPSDFCADEATQFSALPPSNPPVAEQRVVHTASSMPVPTLTSPSASAPLLPPMPSLSPRRGHRRAASEESPWIIQAAAFTRVASADCLARERPSTVWTTASPALIPITQARARARANAAPSRAQPAMPVPDTPLRRRRSRTKSLSDGPKLDDPLFVPPTAVAASTVHPSSAISRPLDASNSVEISVMDPSTGSRELGRAALDPRGLTMCLRSYHKPEEMEVGWACVPSVDEEGRAYTQWEIRLRPRGGAVSSSSTPAPAASSKVLVWPPTPAGSAPSVSAFNKDPTNAPLLPTMPSSEDSPHPPSLKSGMSSANIGIAPSFVGPDGWRRESSSSASRSVPPSHHGSISSQSSLVGPPTPHHRKQPETSEQAAVFDLDAMLADPTYPRPPLSPSSSAFDLTKDDFSSPAKIGRAASYACVAEHCRVRQFSTEQDAYLPRSASFAVDGTPHAKSPKHYRFACYLPPVTDGIDFAALAAEARRKSLLVEEHDQSHRARMSTKEFAPVPKADDGSDHLPSPRASSFLASRARRRSLAPPPSTLVLSTPTSEASPASSPCTPSSLEHGALLRADPQTPTKLGRSVRYPDAESPSSRGSSTPRSSSSPLSPLPPDVSPALSHSVSFASESGESSGVVVGFEDDFDPEPSRKRAKAVPEQRGRMLSKWSDTEDGGTDDGEGLAQTSWSQLPDLADADA
ncbi:hypothetical protein JCM21900_004586 [Sporobolomyces salmonicolor]